VSEPRLLKRERAAAYCGVSPSRFSQLVKAGTLPSSVPGTTLYDRKAIDAALDKLGGLTAEPQLSPLQEWLAKDGDRAA
jgi:predicted DNA-binding transcriptional regulator AlpA